MPYAAEISRANPSCFLFVIDQSGSMDERMEGGTSKAAFVADVLNKTLYNLITRCTKADGCRPYFDVGVVAYGGNGVGSGFEGALSGKILHSLPDIEKSPLRIEERVKKVPDGAGGLVEQSTKFPVWFEPKNSGGTPMCEAMRRAAEVLVEWSDAHPNCYPATVIHVTDGQSTDGDPEQIAAQLRQISTNDGQVLLFNLHIDATESAPVIFPATEGVLPDQYSKGSSECRALARHISSAPPRSAAIRRPRSRGSLVTRLGTRRSSTSSRSVLGRARCDERSHVPSCDFESYSPEVSRKTIAPTLSTRIRPRPTRRGSCSL